NAGSVSQALSNTTQQTSTGGSEFAPASVLSPRQAPLAIFTVLYRPTVFDAHNFQALLAGLEGTLLLFLTLKRWRWVWSSVKSFRRQPYVAFAAAYTGMFVIAFSSIANFGILARERVQLLPLMFVFLAIPPRSRTAPSISPEAAGGEVSNTRAPSRA